MGDGGHRHQPPLTCRVTSSPGAMGTRWGSPFGVVCAGERSTESETPASLPRARLLHSSPTVVVVVPPLPLHLDLQELLFLCAALKDLRGGRGVVVLEQKGRAQHAASGVQGVLCTAGCAGAPGSPLQGAERGKHFQGWSLVWDALLWLRSAGC